MLKFAVLNDLHFADNPPIGRQPGYRDQLFEKLHGVLNYLNANKIEVLVITGDVFHIKRPDRVSHDLVNMLISAFRFDYDGRVLICPGNHDLTESGIESLDRQPLGTLFHAEAAQALMTEEGYFSLNHGKSRVLFLGRHYDTDGDLDPFYYVLNEDDADLVRSVDANVVVMVAHGSIVPPKAEPIYPHIQVNSIPWDEGPLTPDLLLCGHLHEDWGIKKVKDGPIYANLGSFGRPSRNQLDVDTRDFLVVTVGDDLTLSLERVPIPNMRPASEVFIEKTDVDDEDDALAEFAEQLSSAIMLEETSLDDALAALGDVPDDVKARLKKYLEDAGL